MEKGNARAEEGEDGGSPKGAKRARKNDAGDSVPTGEEEDANEEEEQAPPPKRVKTLPRDVDGYIPGSIVRIQLRNFVTYDAVEFRPGPFLNMILGPNGTGKSSIACAICIGLNWPAKLLGRSTDLSSFVKTHTETGHIEIELKSPAGQPNLVIKRGLNATSRTSSFMINGHSATGGEVTERLARLNVQVGNLCSFLPQDKVSAFAAMSPVELLRETENAAGDERLKMWHETLIEAGAELKGVVDKINGEKATMQQLVERNEGIERDVQRYRERKKIERSISLLKVLVPVQHYREARVEYHALRKHQRALHERVSRLKERNKPAHALLGKLENQAADLQERRGAMKEGLRAMVGKVTKCTKACDALENDLEDVQNALANLKKNEKTRLSNIKRAQTEIAALKEEMEIEVKVESEADLKADRNAVLAKFHATPYAADTHALDQRAENLERRKSQNRRNEENGRAELRNLDSVEHVKLQNLHSLNADAADTVRFIRQNQGMFKMEIFEPPLLSVTVPDQNFAAAVENNFNLSALKMFVCQCKEDYDLLNKTINDNPGLGRSARVPTWYRPGSEADLAPPPMSPNELTERGFDGYAIDYVQCPEGLKWYLKRELNMHRTAISRRGVRDLQGAIDAVGRPGPNGRSSNTTFIDGDMVHQVSRSRYGQHKLMASATKLGGARNFGKAQVNPADKQRVDDLLRRCKEEATEIHDEDRAVGMEKKRLEGLLKEHKKLMVGRFALLRPRLETTLSTALAKGDAAQEGAKLRKQIMAIVKKRVKFVTDAVECSRDVIMDQMKATTLGLQYFQICAKIAALKELCDRKDAKYQIALAEFNTVDVAFLKKKKEARELMEHSQKLLLTLPEELRDEYSVTEQAWLAHDKAVAQAEQDGTDAPRPGDDVDMRTMEELQTELETQEAKLNMNMNTNPGVEEQYEKRKQDIEQLEKTIENRERTANKIQKNIKNARDHWEPALQALVTSIGKKFSDAFDRIGCAGEIRVRQEESYAQWAIDILVKFRDTEKLQLLTAQRQSGGERSLTTILYLMSLTEEARAPFSLVDEINQGMDQRAERMVHNSMVEVTCKPDSAQYFLITPKLLPDLDYHERMKCLIVNNGEWLPEESGLGNMMSMIDGFVAKNPGR
ncbi:hypothetical protein C8R47DRAFT_1024336 [Mycena vitilis]|nr:hypothetical protein C8R47DRAFT_1024336 [Mycena vitilis]